MSKHAHPNIYCSGCNGWHRTGKHNASIGVDAFISIMREIMRLGGK